MAGFRAFPHQFLDEIRSRVPISGVVGRHVQLKPKPGGEFTGLCPFHNEKTPSFTVSDRKGFYHCFGCGAHGDIFRFLTEHTGAAFPEVVEQLASEAGVPMPARDEQAEQRYQKQIELMDVMEMAAGFYQQQLYGREGQVARDYLQGRSLNNEMIAAYRLGYSPDSRDALKNYLLQKNVTEAQMVEAGLIIEPDSGTRYDRFRGRLMFPILDRRGRVIAFGGRILGEGEPKYLNSPETPLFHKGKVLYGMHSAREAAHQAGTMLVCEGYMDVIALAQGGIAHAVAPLGTSLTEDHVRLLWATVDTPVMCLDGDNAGKRAQVRAAEMALPHLQPGKSLAFVSLPAGQDPDDVMKQGGASAMHELVDSAKPLSDVLWEIAAGDEPLDTPEARAAFDTRVRGLTGRIGEPSVRSYYDQFFKDKLWAFKRSGNTQANRGVPRRAGEKRPGAVAEYKPMDAMAMQFLLFFVAHPERLESAETEELLMQLALPEGDAQALYEVLMECLESEQAMTHENVTSELESRDLKNAVETARKTRYDEAFLGADASQIVVDAGWNYMQARYQFLLLEEEVTRSTNDTGDGDVERLWELKQQKDASERAMRSARAAYEDVIDDVAATG